MSKGSGRVERRIGELFAATRDRGLSVADLARHAFELADDVAPDRKQRLSATRAAHRLLNRASAAKEAIAILFDRLVAETVAVLGREPRPRVRDEIYFSNGRGYVPLDPPFLAAMQERPCWSLWKPAWTALDRQRKQFNATLIDKGGWRATETQDRRLWFHPADFPMRVWAVAILPEGVVWADAEITGVDNTYVRVRYRGEVARLDRERLARSWAIYRNVFFTSSQSGYAASSFDRMWQERYWRPGSVAPPAMQMPLDDAIKLLGVPADFSREDVIAAFRRKAFLCHPDHGGTEAQFTALVKARDRLLASIGTRAAAPKAPEFAPKGMKLRYGLWRPSQRMTQLEGDPGKPRLQ
jgi:hypothetical protein